MKYDDRKVAGALLFIASVQCVIGIIVAEALYPGYSTSENYISDLGVGPSALIFNSSVFLLGIIAVVGVYFIQRAFGSRLLSLLLTLTGVGAMGVGLFPENFGIIQEDLKKGMPIMVPPTQTQQSTSGWNPSYRGAVFGKRIPSPFSRQKNIALFNPS